MEPPWLASAYLDLRAGVKELPGERSHPRILEWFETVGWQGLRSDETPNCGAFVAFHLLRAGFPRERLPSKPFRARHYLSFGARVSPIWPPLGAICVLTRGGKSEPGPEALEADGHVGLFLMHGYPGWIHVLGANHGDRVAIDAFPVHRLLGMRWPSE